MSFRCPWIGYGNAPCGDTNDTCSNIESTPDGFANCTFWADEDELALIEIRDTPTP